MNEEVMMFFCLLNIFTQSRMSSFSKELRVLVSTWSSYKSLAAWTEREQKGSAHHSAPLDHQYQDSRASPS